MIDLEKLKPVLEGYKTYFPEHWKNEKYKWVAVRHFQDHWNIDDDNFGAMFKQATGKTVNLLASGYSYPQKMIINFARADDDAVREMFRNLFDENVELDVRMEAFQSAAEDLRVKYNDGTWRSHYQNTNAISTYLWLRYPDKYYIFKYELFRAVATELSSDYVPKRNGSVDTVISGFRMYDEICEAIARDKEIRNMIQGAMDSACYPDPAMKTATIDVGFYLARFYVNGKKSGGKETKWVPENYSPNLSVDDWMELLHDDTVFNAASFQIMKRMKDYGGEASCKQLSTKYGETVQFYINGMASVGQRVAEKTGCEVAKRENGSSRWWAVLCMGRDAGKGEEGSFVWRLRNELSTALDQMNLESVELVAPANGPEPEKRRYWWLTANPKIWSLGSLPIGEEMSYTLYNDNGNKRRIFQNFLDARPGDVLIGYEANPVKKVVAICRITRENDGKNLYFEKVEGLASPVDYVTFRECPELQKMEFFVQPNGSLFKLTMGEYAFVMDLIREENPLREPVVGLPKYTKEDFLKKVYMTEEQLKTLQDLLHDDKNIILEGAPGVGKTYVAKRLAYVVMGEVDDSRIEMVQFHQNYSYEDFVMGYRPEGQEFKLKEGIFYRFCQQAANHPELDYFFIIDEINRGNLSRIFGELLMLIDKSWRGGSVTLAYSGMPFSVPENLYIIGMMNTADRSLAMMDYALRRRFGHYKMDPAFSSDGFIAYQDSFENETFNALIGQIKALNREILEDNSLGRGFQIGHSYFCGREEKGCTDEWMHAVVEYEILPMLEEYWFDEPVKLRRWEANLRGVFND